MVIILSNEIKLPVLTHIPNYMSNCSFKTKDQSIVIHFIYALCIAVNKETRTSPHQNSRQTNCKVDDKNCSGMMPSEMLRDVWDAVSDQNSQVWSDWVKCLALKWFKLKTSCFFSKTAQTMQNWLISVGNNVLMYIWINWLLSITKYLVMCLLVRFVPYEVNEDDDYTSYENMAIFLISMYQYITLAVVFSKGRPYRKTIFSNCKYELGSFKL